MDAHDSLSEILALRQRALALEQRVDKLEDALARADEERRRAVDLHAAALDNIALLTASVGKFLHANQSQHPKQPGDEGAQSGSGRVEVAAKMSSSRSTSSNAAASGMARSASMSFGARAAQTSDRAATVAYALKRHQQEHQHQHHQQNAGGWSPVSSGSIDDGETRKQSVVRFGKATFIAVPSQHYGGPQVAAADVDFDDDDDDATDDGAMVVRLADRRAGPPSLTTSVAAEATSPRRVAARGTDATVDGFAPILAVAEQSRSFVPTVEPRAGSSYQAVNLTSRSQERCPVATAPSAASDAAALPAMGRRKTIVDIMRETTQPARGLTDRHPAIAVLDVMFVIFSYVSVAVTIFEVLPHAPIAPDTPAFPYVLAWHAVSSTQAMVWIASRFFLSQRRGAWEIIDDRPSIRRAYLRTWFLFDVVVCVPYDFAFAGWAWEAYKWFQLRHVLRLGRIFWLGRSSNPLLGSRLWFRFVSYCFFLLLVVVALGVVFWTLESDNYSLDQAVYWAVATMTSVGYGDVVPLTFRSRMFVNFGMFFGVMMLSTTTAFATSFLTSKDRLQEEEDAKKQTLFAMLEHYGVPWDVQKEVIGAVPAMLRSGNEAMFKDMTSKMPPFVSAKLSNYVRSRMLRGIDMFRELPVEHLVRLSSLMSQEFFPPGALVIEEGTECTKIYWIIRGVTQVSMARVVECDDGSANASVQNLEIVVDRLVTLRDGDHFGDLEAEGEMARATVEAVTLCEMLTLSRADYSSLLQDPEIGQSLKLAMTLGDTGTLPR